VIELTSLAQWGRALGGQEPVTDTLVRVILAFSPLTTIRGLRPASVEGCHVQNIGHEAELTTASQTLRVFEENSSTTGASEKTHGAPS
jgi:hypothetical protein